MNKIFAIAGVALSLTLAAPLAAQADNYHHNGGNNGHYDHRGGRDYHGRERHEFSHWRPGLERQHYRGFGRPVYYHDHYRVRAYDHSGRIVFLNVNPYTGVILSVGY